MELVCPSQIALDERQDDQTRIEIPQEQKKNTFRNPIKNVRELKNDEETSSSYCRLKEEKQYSSLQFKELPVKIPYCAITLAGILFVVGSAMITLGVLLLTGRIQTQYSDRTWPLILIGSLVFLPGFYHLRVAYWAWKGDKNFSFDDIPDLDWP